MQEKKKRDPLIPKILKLINTKIREGDTVCLAPVFELLFPWWWYSPHNEKYIKKISELLMPVASEIIHMAPKAFNKSNLAELGQLWKRRTLVNKLKDMVSGNNQPDFTTIEQLCKATALYKMQDIPVYWDWIFKIGVESGAHLPLIMDTRSKTVWRVHREDQTAGKTGVALGVPVELTKLGVALQCMFPQHVRSNMNHRWVSSAQSRLHNEWAFFIVGSLIQRVSFKDFKQLEANLEASDSYILV